MELQTPWQKLTFLGIVAAFFAIFVVGTDWVIQSLSDANQTALGHWFDRHSSAIWGFLVGAVPSAITYVFGKRVAKRQTLVSGAAAVEDAADGAEAASRLRSVARAHGFAV
jgi:hypothetical protein